jgi:predicted nuclease with TOPRIM domain
MEELKNIFDPIILISAGLASIGAIFAIIKKNWQKIKNFFTRNKKIHESITSLSINFEKILNMVERVSEENQSQSSMLKELSEKYNKLNLKIDKNEIDRIRWEILTFSNMCSKQPCPNKDEFTHIINLYKKYHALIEEQGLTNGQIDLEYKFITDLYCKKLKTNTF